MPRMNLKQAAAPPPVADTLTQLAQRLQAGSVVPIIGNTLTYDLLLTGYDELVNLYLKNYLPQYLPHDDLDLARLTQYCHITHAELSNLDKGFQKGVFLNLLKNIYLDRIDTTILPAHVSAAIEEDFDKMTLSKLMARLGYAMIPEGHANPWRMLAEFPLPVYLTTCCHDLLEVALREAGKTPHAQICRWTELEVKSVFDGKYEPSASEPLVYYLHGRDNYAESLVLTENDYLEFLTAVTRNKGNISTDVIPPKVREVLNTSSLMLLGYNLRQWEFIALFWGLIKPRTKQMTSIVNIQLEPSEFEKQYVKEYLQLDKFEVYWGAATDHLGRLYEIFKE